MIPEVLHAMLARVRTAVRVDGLTVGAGHGVADPNYRPPRLPYGAVIGPLNLEDEPERDPVHSVFLWMRSPGHVLGAPRSAADRVPAPGDIDLLLDGEAQVSVAIDFGALANQSFTDPDVGPQVAALAEQALRAAVDAGVVTTDGAPITDPERVAELRASTVRWQRARLRLVLASGRRGSLPDPEIGLAHPSAVVVTGGDAALIAALGLGAGSLPVAGRLYRHRVPSPTGMAVDLRVDLWSGSQGELARISEAWTRITPTRGRLLTQTALLAADVPDGGTTLRLLTAGEPRGRWSLALAEAGSGFVERLSDVVPALAGAAVIEPPGLRVGGAGEAVLQVYEAPAVPQPWRPDHPAPQGYALSLGLRVEPGAQDGNAFTLARLRHGARTALRLDLGYVLAAGELQADLAASAERADGTAFGPAVGRLPAAILEGGVAVHVTVDARLGLVGLFIDGVAPPAPPGAPPPAAAPGTPAGGSDLTLILGDAAAAPGTVQPYRIDHLHLHARPLGAPDPQARRALTPAGAWGVGDPIALVRSDDGVGARGEAFRAIVTAGSGDQLTLDRPVRGDWPAGAALVYRDSLFFAQRQLKRRDDFMNRLYRLTLEYRVSGYLDERFPELSAALVETPEVETRELAFLLAEERDPTAPVYPTRPVGARPGVEAVIAASRRTPET